MRGSIVIVCIRAGARWEDGRKKGKDRESYSWMKYIVLQAYSITT